MMKVRVVTSTQLVKYYVVVMINLWPSEEGGEIAPTRSNAHYEKGHEDMTSFSSCVGVWIILLCIWHL